MGLATKILLQKFGNKDLIQILKTLVQRFKIKSYYFIKYEYPQWDEEYS